MPQPTFSTINQFADKQPAFSAGGLRALIFNERSNGHSFTVLTAFYCSVLSRNGVKMKFFFLMGNKKGLDVTLSL